jgi:hypothetical protein
MRRCLVGLRFPERHQRRFRWVHAPTKAGKPFRQHGHDLAGVRFPFASHDAVLRKAPQAASTLPPWLDLVREPLIQDMLEEYMGQHG